MKKFLNIKNILILLGILALTGIDQIIKLLIVKNLYNSSTKIINGFLNFTYIENTGGAFGIGSNNILVFILINIIVIGIIFKLLVSRKDELNIISMISASMIISGGMGNLIDRIFRGYVVDYIDVSPLIKYPVFNFADIIIVLGVILLVINILFEKDKKSI